MPVGARGPRWVYVVQSRPMKTEKGVPGVSRDLTAKEAAAIVGYSTPKPIRRLCRAGAIGYRLPGSREWRITREELDRIRGVG